MTSSAREIDSCLTLFRIFLLYKSLLAFDYHMKLHYSQTYRRRQYRYRRFDYHMKLHYSQTFSDEELYTGLFDYHMKLHYSQTQMGGLFLFRVFDYHMKLHYSQTTTTPWTQADMFDYHMKLHYSQTSNLRGKQGNATTCAVISQGNAFKQLHITIYLFFLPHFFSFQ